MEMEKIEMGGLSDGDDLMWDGLACPPLEDCAFNLDMTCTLDLLMLERDLLDNQFVEIREDEDMKAVYDYLETEASKSMKDRNHGRGKVLKMAMQELNLREERLRSFLGRTRVGDDRDNKKRKFMDPIAGGNQLAEKRNKRIADCESKLWASRQVLHKAYDQAKEVKEGRHIEVVDFQKPQMQQQQPGSKGKAKGKPSLRQKLMAMGTRKANKKFPPYKMLCSCN